MSVDFSRAIQNAISSKVEEHMNKRGELNGEKMELIGDVQHESTEHFNVIYFECKYPSSKMKVYYGMVYSTLFVDKHYMTSNVIDATAKGYSIADIKQWFKNYLKFTLQNANDEL